MINVPRTDRKRPLTWNKHSKIIIIREMTTIIASVITFYNRLIFPQVYKLTKPKSKPWPSNPKIQPTIQTHYLPCLFYFRILFSSFVGQSLVEIRQMRLAVFPIQKFSIWKVLIVFESKFFDSNNIKAIWIKFWFK